VPRLIQGIDWAFLTIGANYGFWSSLVSSWEFDHREAIAVEPAAAAFTMLSDTRLLNVSRFRLCHAAIGAHSNPEVKLFTSISSISDAGAQVRLFGAAHLMNLPK